MRPRSIELFDKIYLASIAVSVVGVALGWAGMSAQTEARMPGISTETRGYVLIGSLVVGTSISLLLWFLVARKASNVAKWIVVVFTAIAAFMALSALFLPTAPKDLNFATNFIATALSVFATWLLFKPDAVSWLESGGADGPGDPKTFD